MDVASEATTLQERMKELRHRKERILILLEQELELLVSESEATHTDPLLSKYEDLIQDRGFDGHSDREDGNDVHDLNIPAHKTKSFRPHNKRELPVKLFKSRDSLLTTLLKNPHINSFRNIFLAILVIFSTNTLFLDWLNHGSIFNFYHLNILASMFSGFSHVIITWGYMFAFSLLGIYLCLTGYAQIRWHLCRGSAVVLKVYDITCLLLFIFYLICFVVFPACYSMEHHLPPVSMIILLSEQVRFLMKSYAFVRECAARVVTQQHNQLQVSPEKMNCPICIPDFSCYLYFLFVPTLVYCDSYPRTATIRWNVVFWEFASVVICVVYVYYAYFRYLYEAFHDFRGGASLSFHRFVVDSFACMLPGSLMLFVGFFALLHSWMNAFAEMLRFGDRLFYKDWWTATSFSAWYRTWNVIVHDWLYMYVFRDMYLITRSRALSTSAVFALSALFHEYILTLSFGYFYPVLLVLFGSFGFLFTFVRSRAGVFNIGVWVALFMGMGVLTLLYTMEWYARRNCPSYVSPTWDFITPRTWTCLRMDG